jgi:signal transduction histidine kinase
MSQVGGSASYGLDEQRLKRLIDVGRSLVAQLDLELILDLVLETARELTGAAYAALGILDQGRHDQLERFLTSGIDPDTHRAIGDLPRGRGILGALIDEPRPLRLDRVGDDPRSYGFPAAHPPMDTFLGVPILIRGEAWGNLYLTEKAGGMPFDAGDEQAAVTLADWAAIAIDNARLYAAVQSRRDELERAVRGLEATQAVAVAIGAETDLDLVLELIVKRGRALLDARSVVILLAEGDELVVVAFAGEAERPLGARIPLGDSTSGHILAEGRIDRIDDVSKQLRIAPEHYGVPHAHAALLAPLVYRGRPVGVLAAFDRQGSSPRFTDEDEQAARFFAASAATAVAMAKSVAEDQLRHSLEAAEAERRHWARELHDETLQGLGALRVVLAAAQRQAASAETRQTLAAAMTEVESEIDNLRAIITELRPASLDELGLQPAIESLLARHQAIHGLEIDFELRMDAGNDGRRRLAPEVETTIYRLVQESLTNVAKHGEAEHVGVTLREEDGRVEVEVRDDGRGFAVSAETSGYGLAGIRERVELAGGSVTVESGERGTRIAATIPARFLERRGETRDEPTGQTVTSPRSNA